MVLIRQWTGELRGQRRVSQDTGGGAPLDDDSVQGGVDVQIDRVARGIDEFLRELAPLIRGQVPSPGKDHGQGVQDDADTLIAGQQGGDHAGCDIRRLLALAVVLSRGDEQILPVTAFDVDPMELIDGLGDLLGMLRQVRERNGRHSHTTPYFGTHSEVKRGPPNGASRAATACRIDSGIGLPVPPVFTS